MEHIVKSSGSDCELRLSESDENAFLLDDLDANKSDLKTPLSDEPNDGSLSCEHGNQHRPSPRWRKLRHIRLLAGFILVMMFTLGFAFSFALSQKPSVCSTRACVLASAKLLHALAPSSRNVDPCVDFHAFACGGWESRQGIDLQDTELSQRIMLEDSSQKLLRHILESKESWTSSETTKAAVTDSRNLHKLKRAYNACMDNEAAVRRGLGPLVDIMFEIQNIFAVVENSTGLGNNLTTVVSYLMGIGVEALISFRSKVDDTDPNTTSLLLRPVYSSNSLSKYSLSNPGAKVKYRDVMEQTLAVLLRAARQKEAIFTSWDPLDSLESRSSAPSENLIDSVMGVETKLTQATPSPANSFKNNSYYHPTSIQNAQPMIGPLDLRMLLRDQSEERPPDSLIVVSPSYLQAVNEVLQSATVETIQAYLIWRVVQTFASDVEHDSLKALLDFEAEAGAALQRDELRWKRCVRHVDKGLGWLLGRLWVKWHLPLDAKSYGTDIVVAIKDAYIRQIQVSSWMSAKVASRAIKKLQQLIADVAYPDKYPNILDPVELGDRYASVIITDDYFQNIISFAKAKNHWRFAKLYKSAEEAEWDVTVDMVNAWYSPAANRMIVPAGLLQPPVYYGPRLPRYLTYGAFGAIMGHEMSHAIDGYGRYHDLDRGFSDWWDDQTADAFAKKSRCFVDQYSNFSIHGSNNSIHKVNGVVSIEENLADAGGLRAAFRAWGEHDKNRPDELLVGLEVFSKQQLFFLAYGSWWCSTVSPAKMEAKVQTARHPPHFARILGATANSRGFREAFNCPVKKPTCELL